MICMANGPTPLTVHVPPHDGREKSQIGIVQEILRREIRQNNTRVLHIMKLADEPDLDPSVKFMQDLKNGELGDEGPVRDLPAKTLVVLNRSDEFTFCDTDNADFATAKGWVPESMKARLNKFSEVMSTEPYKLYKPSITFTPQHTRERAKVEAETPNNSYERRNYMFELRKKTLPQADDIENELWEKWLAAKIGCSQSC